MLYEDGFSKSKSGYSRQECWNQCVMSAMDMGRSVRDSDAVLGP